LSNVPAPAPAASTHYWLVMNGAVWTELQPVTKARSILKHSKIVNFIIKLSIASNAKTIGLFEPEIASLRVTYFALPSMLVEIGPLPIHLIVSSFLVCCNLPVINPPSPGWDFCPCIG
jgi:hypothetical protein